MQKLLVFSTKLLLLLVLIWTVSFFVVAMSYEFRIESGLEKNPFFAWHKNSYKNIRAFITQVEQEARIKSEISNYFTNIENESRRFFQEVEGFRRDKDLYDAFFLYVVSGNLPSLRTIVEHHWGKHPDFVDFYVLSEDNILLYKYGSHILIPTEDDSSYLHNFREKNDTIEYTINWQDETFGKTLQFHVLFRRERFQAWLLNIPLPIIMRIGEAFLLSEKSPRKFLTATNGDFSTQYFIHTFPLEWRSESIGDVRFFTQRHTLMWVFKTFLRALLILGMMGVIIGFCFWLEHRVHKLISHKKTKEKPENEIEEQNIRWVEEFITHQKEEKK